MQNFINKIHNEDSRDILKELPDDSIDCFIEDMPFNTTAAKFEYEVDLCEYWELRKRVAKPGANFILFAGNGLFTAKIMLSNPDWFRYELVWIKNTKTGQMNAKWQPLRQCEKLYYFNENGFENIEVFFTSKNESTYNPQLGKGKPIKQFNKYTPESNRVYGSMKSTHSENHGTRQPTNVLYFKSEKQCNDARKKFYHPTQKPLQLMRYLVKTYSNPGDIVFDGFAGSGSLAEACMMEDRDFICAEWDNEYYENAVKRLDNRRDIMKNQLTIDFQKGGEKNE